MSEPDAGFTFLWQLGERREEMGNEMTKEYWMGEMSHSGQPQPSQMHEIRCLTNGIEIKSHETSGLAEMEQWNKLQVRNPLMDNLHGIFSYLIFRKVLLGFKDHFITDFEPGRSTSLIVFIQLLPCYRSKKLSPKVHLQSI